MEILQRQILSRLRRGPADEDVLARYCDLPRARHVRPFLEQLVGAGKIRRDGERYALPLNPLSPAGSIVIPQFRWGSTRLS